MTEKKIDDDVIDVEIVAVDKQPKPARGKISKLSIFVLILLLIAIGAGGYAGYLGWQQLQQQQSVASQLQQSLQQQQSHVSSIAGNISNSKKTEQATVKALQEQLFATQQRLNSQNKRLLSISTTTKEDWQLLEARYLLRLANQRLMTERDSVGSVALLHAADNILRDLDDVELFAIRKSVAQDIAKLKLAPSIDRDGTYLRLIGLASNLKQLPAIKPLSSPMLDEQSNNTDAAAEEPGATENTGEWWQPAYQWAQAQLHWASDYIRIRHHDDALKVLPPESQMYVTQNLRLNLEQAQLALMSESQDIYRSSLIETIELLTDYYQLNPQVDAFISEIEQLTALNIRRSLPSISGSLAQLDAYIERLHKLEPSAAMPQSSTPLAGDA